ncbi:MAG: hypothetical protein MJH09_05170 [Cetobacterium sp.]|nr:hypothetical protein [Cetobacterium sp.]
MIYLGIIICILAIFFICFLNKRSCEKYKRTLLDPTEMMMMIFSICLGAYSFSGSHYFSSFNVKTCLSLAVMIMLAVKIILKGFKETDILTGITILIITIILIPLGSFVIANGEIFASAIGFLIAVYFIIKFIF